MVPTMVDLDPSMTAFGWAVLSLGAEPYLIRAGVIETKAMDAKKRKRLGISVAEDDARRVRFIRRQLAAVLREHRPAIVAIEAAAGSKSANTAKALAEAQTIAACVVDEVLGDAQAVYVTALEAGNAVGVHPAQRTTKSKAAKGEKLTKEQERAANREARKRRDERKAAIGRAVVERFGAGAWCRALPPPSRADVSTLEHALDECWEGARDAAAVGLAAWERPEVAAVRRMAGSAA